MLFFCHSFYPHIDYYINAALAFASAILARNPCLLPQAKRLCEAKCGGKPNGLKEATLKF